MSNWRSLARFYLRHRCVPAAGLAQLAVVGGLDLAAAIAVPLLSARIIDALVAGDAAIFWRQLGWLAVVTVIRPVFNVAAGVMTARINEQIASRLRIQVIGAALGQRLEFFERQPPGDLLSRTTNDTNVLKGGVTAIFVQCAFDALTVLVVVAVLWRTEWSLTIALMLTLPISVLYGPFASRRLQHVNRRLRDAVGRTTACFQDWLVHVESVKAFAIERRALDRCEAASEDLRRASVRTASTGALIGGANVILVGLPALLVFGYGGLLTFESRMSIGEMFSFYALAAYFVGPMQRLLSQLYTTLPTLYPVAARVEEITGLATSPPPAAAAPRPIGVVADNVGFCPAANARRRFQLQVRQFTVCRGDLVAVTGPNGAGKTMFGRVLCGLAAPSSGTVVYVGVDGGRVEASPGTAWLLPQRAVCFPGTVLENVTLFEPSPDPARAREALSAVGLDRFVAQYDGGLDARLEPGVMARMSGGELQRLGLARAVYAGAPIIVLDEPFANVEEGASADLMQLLVGLKRHHALVLITHASRLIALCDRTYAVTPVSTADGIVSELAPLAAAVCAH